LVVDFLKKDLQLFCQSGFYDRMAEIGVPLSDKIGVFSDFLP